MRNDSFIAENWNNQFEPNDSREESIMECPDCDGSPAWSGCCGSTVTSGICNDCECPCTIVICQRCKGDGVIEI